MGDFLDVEGGRPKKPFGGADATRAKLGLRQALRDGDLPAILDRVGLLASLACFFGCFFSCFSEAV